MKLTGTAITILWSLILFFVWHLGTAYSLPSLVEVGRAWGILLMEGGLLYELIFVSLWLNVQVLALSTLISVGLAYLTVDIFWSVPARVLSVLRFLGMSGLSIVFMRLLGGGHILKVGMLTFIMSTFFATSMIDVVASVTQQEYDHTRTLKMSRWRGVWEVVVLGRLDQTFDALRQNAAIGWMSLTMVESFSKSEGGVGVLMLNAEKYRSLAPIFAIQLTVLFVGIFQDRLIGWVKSIFCPHVKYTLGKR